MMEINNMAELKMAILKLEEKERLQKKELISEVHNLYESMKPANILKEIFHKITGSSGEGGLNVLNAAIGVGAGVLSKKLFVRGSGNLIRKILGIAIELGVAKAVAKNSGHIADKIKTFGIKAIKKIITPGKTRKAY